MVNSGNRGVKSSHDVLKALLRAKNDAENRLNEISAEIKFLERPEKFGQKSMEQY